jgi:hypothetical protein
MQKASVMAWLGGTVRSNQVLVQSVRTARGVFSLPLAGETVPDGDYILSGAIQLDGDIPVFLPLGSTPFTGASFLRLAGQVIAGKVLNLEAGLPDGAFHSQVLAWGERLLLADSTPAGSVVTLASAKDGGVATSLPTATEEKTPEVKIGEVSTPSKTIAEPVPAPEPARTAEATPELALAWAPTSLPILSEEEIDRVPLSSPPGTPVAWPHTTEPCVPLDGEPGKVIVQAAASAAPTADVSTPSLRRGRRKADKVAEVAPEAAKAPEAPAAAAVGEASPGTGKVRNLDGLSF